MSSTGPAAAAKARHSKQPRSGPVVEPPAKKARKAPAPKIPAPPQEAPAPAEPVPAPVDPEQTWSYDDLLKLDAAVVGIIRNPNQPISEETLAEIHALFPHRSLAEVKLLAQRAACFLVIFK